VRDLLWEERDLYEDQGGSLTLLDEFGLVEVDLPAGTEAPDEASLAVVEGVVEVVFGCPVVKAARAARWLPGGEAIAGMAGAA
jgi:hypothetical protein